MTKVVDGYLMEKMLANGLSFLKDAEERINGLNVFPVADGDTGSNMRMTLEKGLRFAEKSENLGEYCKTLSRGMLLGARGNSGVILSQIFKGIYTALTNIAMADAFMLKDAFENGYKFAYTSVISPVEGTMLTVARKGIENIEAELNSEMSVEGFLQSYLDEMHSILPQTPDMLPVLKEYGVVDSGAVGYITIVEGMLRFLMGDVLATQINSEAEDIQEASEYLFNENSCFEKGYCMEFILQLLHASQYMNDFSLNRFSKCLIQYGESIVVSMDGTRVKTHIHTMVPGNIIGLCQQYGEFVTFKLENMQVQHNDFIAKHGKKMKESKKEFAIIAVANGAGMKRVYKELGCNVILDGGEFMNSSTQDFLEAFSEANAEVIAVILNNKNIELAAKQAAEMFAEAKVELISTESMVEGYYALSCDIPGENVSKRLAAMYEGAENIITLAETVATKEYKQDNFSCKIGDEILIMGEELICSGKDEIDVIMEGLSKIENIGEKECCVLFRGEDTNPSAEERLEERIMEEYPILETVFLEGGQKIYSWLLGIF